jgi:hypothetical protein
MAVDGTDLGPCRPGGAVPGREAARGRAQVGLVAEAWWLRSEGLGDGGLPSTAARRRRSAHRGLNMAGGSEETARRDRRAREARATATDAVCPPIPSGLTKILGRSCRPHVTRNRCDERKTRRACRLRSGLETCPKDHREGPGAKAREGASASEGRENDRRDQMGSVSLAFVTCIWQESAATSWRRRTRGRTATDGGTSKSGLKGKVNHERPMS